MEGLWMIFFLLPLYFLIVEPFMTFIKIKENNEALCFSLSKPESKGKKNLQSLHRTVKKQFHTLRLSSQTLYFESSTSTISTDEVV
jgi:hypothetical protein